MNMELRYLILMVVAGIGLVKALFGVIGPARAKRFVRWWRDAGVGFHKFCGAVCVTIAGLVLAVVLMQHQLVDWILILFAVLLAWGGNLYFREADLHKLIDFAIMRRSDTFLRVVSLFGGAICGILLWIAITGAMGG